MRPGEQVFLVAGFFDGVYEQAVCSESGTSHIDECAGLMLIGIARCRE